MINIAYIIFTQNSLKIAQKLKLFFGGKIISKSNTFLKTDIHVDDIKNKILKLFLHKTVIIGICNTGILIRSIASKLKNKDFEPPIIAIDDKGKNIIPLLGGHSKISKFGNAIKIATKCADILNGKVIITTASDINYRISLNNPPKGYIFINPENYKNFLIKLLNQQQVDIIQKIKWFTESDLPDTPNAKLKIIISNKLKHTSDNTLIYCPKNIVIGVGCIRGVKSHELINLIKSEIKNKNINQNSIAHIASIDIKSDEIGIHETAKYFNVKAVFFNAIELEKEKSKLINPSKYVFNKFGCHSVSEAAALASTGADSILLTPKVKSYNSTCAIAQSINPIIKFKGKLQGTLYIVGIGPGQDSWRTPEATYMLKQSNHWVSYNLYINFLNTINKNKIHYKFKIGEEKKRVIFALKLASKGKKVALICSGDAGIYAMASLVYELLDSKTNCSYITDSIKRVDVQMAPGISALQSAASRVGAPLGHDFCTISLSDLLTPWEIIKKRIYAAAKADFIINFYNPVSQKRQTQLIYAKNILLKYRSKNCPVILATNVGRKNECINHIKLINLNTNIINMFTLIIIGSTNSKKFIHNNGKEYMYTPRDYNISKKE